MVKLHFSFALSILSSSGKFRILCMIFDIYETIPLYFIETKASVFYLFLLYFNFSNIYCLYPISFTKTTIMVNKNKKHNKVNIDVAFFFFLKKRKNQKGEIFLNALVRGSLFLVNLTVA